MKPLKIKFDTLDYLLGGVGLLVLLSFVIPGYAVVPTTLARISLLVMLLAGGWALWWVLHRLVGVAERTIAVVCVLVGWFLLFGLLVLLDSFLAIQSL